MENSLCTGREARTYEVASLFMGKMTEDQPTILYMEVMLAGRLLLGTVESRQRWTRLVMENNHVRKGKLGHMGW